MLGGLLLFLVHAIGLTCEGRRPLYNAPVRIVSILSSVTILPYYAILAIDPDRSRVAYLTSLPVREGLSKVSGYYAISLLFTIFGIIVAASFRGRLLLRRQPQRQKRRHLQQFCYYSASALRLSLLS